MSKDHAPYRDATAAPIVVVEDDESSRELIVRYLGKLRLANPVVPALDGVVAVEQLATLAATPALVLLDLDLPGRSGLEVLAWLRGQPQLADVPVVMLTGSSELDDIDRAYELGISSYLVKPVGFPALEDVLRRLGTPWALLAPRVRQEA
jgi:CheY-like chemotaxis protein